MAPHPSPVNTRKTSHFDSLEQETFLNVWRTYDRLRAMEDQLFVQFGITPQQYNALRLLRAADPRPLPTLTLANRLVSRAPDITRLLDKLEEQQWIVRERPAENRRVVAVRITNSGKELLDSISDPLRKCHSEQLGHLSAAKLRKLCELLKEARRPHEVENGPWS